MTERNFYTKETYQQFDSFGMLRIHPDHTDGLDWKDSIGRTVIDLITKGRHPKMETGLNACQGEKIIYNPFHTWTLRGRKIQFTLKRHPDYKEKSSRDHWQYYIIYRKIVHRTDSGFKFFVDHLPYLRGLSLWAITLTGNPFTEALFFCSQIPGAIIGNAWNKFIRVIGFIGPEWHEADWNDIGVEIQKGLTGWIKFFRKLLIPEYSLHGKAWQLWIMPDSPDKKLLKRILLKRVGKYNYFLRLMFGDKTVTREQVEGYTHMTSWRWSTRLDQSCRRYVIFVGDAEKLKYNALETDVLEWAWINRKLGSEIYGYPPWYATIRKK